MYSIEELYSVIDGYAPFRLSQEFVNRGGYDNSGILVRSSSNVNKILFSLDLSVEAVKKAKRQGCDTIVTHHPAIYSPLKEVGVSPISTAVAMALNNKMNVISAHLNLDATISGIDYYLAKGLGATEQKIYEKIENDCGYGREFGVSPVKLGEYVKIVKKEFNTKKVTVYGNLNKEISIVASFCGGGAGDIEKLTAKKAISADVIVSSDMPHHVIKQCVETGYCVIILTHYSAENYGFKKFYEYVTKSLGEKVKCDFFTDVRFL